MDGFFVVEWIGSTHPGIFIDVKDATQSQANNLKHGVNTKVTAKIAASKLSEKIKIDKKRKSISASEFFPRTCAK